MVRQEKRGAPLFIGAHGCCGVAMWQLPHSSLQKYITLEFSSSLFNYAKYLILEKSCVAMKLVNSSFLPFPNHSRTFSSRHCYFQHEIDYRAANVQRDTTVSGWLASYNVHVVVLTRYSDVEKDDDQDSNDGEDVFENYYEYLNSYSHRWGIGGFGYVYVGSLRQTYKLDVDC